MSVFVDIACQQFGNAIFKYVYARLFANKNGLKLSADFNYNHIVCMLPQDGRVYTSPTIHIPDDVNILAVEDIEPANYHLEGNRQNSILYKDHIQDIKAFAKPVQDINEINHDDIVIHLRLGDFPVSYQIHPSWYINILEREKFNKLYVVVDMSNIDPRPIPSGYFNFNDYMTALSRFSPEVFSVDAVTDWNYLRTFDRILMSNSTYCWWAGFFSEARKIYTFQKWELSDFPRYTSVHGVFNGEG